MNLFLTLLGGLVLIDSKKKKKTKKENDKEEIDMKQFERYKEMGADNSVSGKIFRNGLCLPSDTKMTEEDMERVCSVIKRMWE